MANITVVSNLQFETNLLRFLIAFILCDSSRLKIAEKKISDCENTVCPSLLEA